LNGTHQFLAYVDDVNPLGDDREYKRSAETVTDASKESSLEGNAYKTNICWCLVARMQVKIET
jgi:hypothetical protein